MLVAARHARERARFPLLPVAYEDSLQAAELVRRALAFCEGVAALDDRCDLVVFLTSFESVPDPTSPMARYAPQRSSLHLVHGYAVAAHVDAGRIYATLFGELAGRALDRGGVVDYVVHVPIGDPKFFIARRDGRDVGVVSIEPGLGSPLYVPDGAAYIAATAVLPNDRGSGTGAALVDAAFSWARVHGHLAACLHFSTANAPRAADSADLPRLSKIVRSVGRIDTG